MKLLFIILAHDRPEQTVELAQILTRAASDAVVMIHFDARGFAGDYSRLCAKVAENPRVRLVKDRVRCRWGGFGLVEAPLRALAQAEAEGVDPDYVILLSGACLPTRPVAQLERFLEERCGLEFIEAEDSSWMIAGLRKERHELFHLVDIRGRPWLQPRLLRLQKRLGVKRRFPCGLIPRFGSQWWALTGATCRQILADVRKNPKRFSFFRSVYIPDEVLFQTYVHALVEPGRIAGFPLTHVQFNHGGKPLVFHDDHLPYVRTLNSFFVRKIGPEARGLRKALLELAASPDDGAGLAQIGMRHPDYHLKAAAQVDFPLPGQIFYRDQHADMIDTVLRRAESPYIVLIGPRHRTSAVMAHLSDRSFELFGDIFDSERVDLGQGRTAFFGLSTDDVAIRDRHPALYLARLRARCGTVPILAWSPDHAPDLLVSVLKDSAALCIACLPLAGTDPSENRCDAPAWRGTGRFPSADLLGISPSRAARALSNVLERSTKDANRFGWLCPEFLCTAMAKDAFRRLVPMIWPPGAAKPGAADRRQAFHDALLGSPFRSYDWFPSLEQSLRRAWSEEVEKLDLALPGDSPQAPANRRLPPVRPQRDRALLQEAR